MISGGIGCEFKEITVLFFILLISVCCLCLSIYLSILIYPSIYLTSTYLPNLFPVELWKFSSH